MINVINVHLKWFITLIITSVNDKDNLRFPFIFFHSNPQSLHWAFCLFESPDSTRIVKAKNRDTCLNCSVPMPTTMLFCICTENVNSFDINRLMLAFDQTYSYRLSKETCSEFRCRLVRKRLGGYLAQRMPTGGWVVDRGGGLTQSLWAGSRNTPNPGAILLLPLQIVTHRIYTWGGGWFLCSAAFLCQDEPAVLGGCAARPGWTRRFEWKRQADLHQHRPDNSAVLSHHSRW